MITVEDPDVDNSINEYEQVPVDVGSLKTLADNPQSRYSEKCFNSVESADNFDKEYVEVGNELQYDNCRLLLLIYIQILNRIVLSLIDKKE